jgi:transcriptional regulator with XRE-family HTH domain
MGNAALARETFMIRQPTVETPVILRLEREKRRMTREEFAELAGLKLNWLRHIENGAKPSAEKRAAIRKVLERCPVHKALGVNCNHKLPVPDDDVLYSPIPR